MPEKLLVLIPARLHATRLPRKPLLDIAGKPMIVHVAERARAAGIGPVAVCTDTEEIAAVVRAAGFEAVLTNPDHPSGSDRIHEALRTYDPNGDVEIVVNVQGDLPTLDPATVHAAASLLDDPAVDVGTAGVENAVDAEYTTPSVVKIVGTRLAPKRLRALYFTRCAAPWGATHYVHHIGLYAYRRQVLDKFIGLPASPLEMCEKLEQLRLLEAGFRIDAALVDKPALGIDTPADLEHVRRLMGA